MDNRLLRYNIFRTLLVAAIYIAASLPVAAQDSTHVITVRDITPGKNFLEGLEGKFTFAPHYSAEMGLGAAFAYTTNAGVSIIGNASTEGYALLGINGEHQVMRRKWELSYDAIYSFLPTYYWGAGYVEASYDGNKRGYDRKKLHIGASLMRIVTRELRIGPVLGYEYIGWCNFQYGEDLISKAFRYGAAASYDSRDNTANPSGGIYFHIMQSHFTDFSRKPHFSTVFTFDWYRKVWEGGILAFDVHSQFSYGEVPYSMLPTIGGPYRMRGYYSGRYRDNCAVSGQLELRQHVWRMFGIAVWAGAANVWGRYDNLSIRHSLPNCGAGLRWRLNPGMSLRFDYGFGKDGQNGFIFGVNEAF